MLAIHILASIASTYIQQQAIDSYQAILQCSDGALKGLGLHVCDLRSVDQCYELEPGRTGKCPVMRVPVCA
jgi:hypothetical protein